jgi:hypothetical protein
LNSELKPAKDVKYFKSKLYVENKEEKKVIPAGLWSVKICSGEAYSDENVIHTHTFLILPERDELIANEYHQREEDDEEFLIEHFDKYWQFNSICSFNTIHYGEVKKCENTYWSTFYPDPKSSLSDLFHN